MSCKPRPLATRRPTSLLGLLGLLARERVGRAPVVAAALAVALALASRKLWRAVTGDAPARAAPPSSPHRAAAPTLVWNGRGYGAAWVEAESDRPLAKRHVYFAVLGEDGRRVGGLTRVALDDRSHGAPQLAWTGSGYGLAFAAWNSSERDQRYEVHLAQLAPDGRVTGAPRLLGPPRVFCREPRLTFAHGAYRVAWTQIIHDPGVAFGRIAASGEWISPPVVIPSNFAEGARLMVQGARDVLAWWEMRPRGEEGNRVRVSWLEGSSREEVMFELSRPYVDGLVLAPDGEATALAWRRFDPQGQGATWIEVAAATSRGVVRSPREVLRHPIIGGLTGSPGSGGLALAWSSVVARESGLYSALVSPQGALLREPRRIDDGDSFAGTPSLAWSGRAHGALWVDGRDGGARVYFATLDARGERVGPAVPVSE